MLDNLVESRKDTRDSRRGGFLFTTTVLVFSLFASGILWSLFARDLGLGSDNLEISSMVAPVIPEVEPPKPEPETPKETRQEQTSKVSSDVPIRRENMARTDEPIVPKDISTAPNSAKARPNTRFDIGKEDVDPVGNPTGREKDGTTGGTNNIGGAIKNQTEKVEDEKDEPPAIKKAEPKVETPKGPIKISSVLNGKATHLPKPAYTPAAIAVRAGGDVNVQVMIDEKGNVISANAVSGHALLRQVSEQAARGAKFSPTVLNGQPVKVTGIIVYKFARP